MKSPQKVLVNAFIFFGSICLKGLKEILSKFLHFWEKNAFKPKFVGWWHLLKMFEKETITPTRSVEIPSLQATQTKRSLEQTTVLEGGKLSRTGSSCGSLCKVKNCATLFIMSQLFICGLKTKDSFLFSPQFFTFRLKFWAISFLFQQYLLFSTSLFYDRRFLKAKEN